MKKKMIIIVVALIVIILGIIGALIFGSNKTNDEYPKIVYIDNTSYYYTDTICENVPRKMSDGIINTFTDSAIMPDMLNSANFGSEYGSMEYMFLDDDKLIVKMGENWYYFEKK